MISKKKIAVIGAGASGLMAAITAAENGADVTVLEQGDKPLRKLLLTGNGRCNFTNNNMDPSKYYLNSEDGFYDCINRFTQMDVIRFFMKLGVESFVKNDYFYPVDEKAETVAHALMRKAESLGIRFVFNYKDADIQNIAEEYDAVIIAAGSRCYKKTGSNGSGYKFFEKLGVKYSRVTPALCPLYSRDVFFNNNAGRRLLATVTAIVDGRPVAEDTGELQIISEGLSGIPVFQVSRFISKAIDMNRTAAVAVNFCPDMDKVPDFLRNRIMDRNEGIRMFPILETGGFEKAQVCAGGVGLDEVNPETMSLKKYPDIYVCGEIVDMDGMCGGYNLQWAWSSGYIAGLNASGYQNY